METLRFTKSALMALPIPEDGKRAEYADSVVNGLRLRITPTGNKSFCVARRRDGRFFRVTLGRFPDMTIERARESAYSALNEMAQTRRNPNERRREEKRRTVTLSDALDAYLKSRAEAGRVKEKTAKVYRDTLRNYSADWMALQLSSITREQVESRHRTITERGIWFGGPSRLIAQGSKTQADLWARVLRAVYRYAYDSHRNENGDRLLPDPPTSILSTKRLWNGTPRRTTRIRNADLTRWMRAVEVVREKAVDTRDDITAAVCDAVDTALFTGLRRSEVLGLAWDRVNMPGRYFWIDKTKNGDPLELPITDTLYAIFTRRQESMRDDSPYVFPNSKGGVITNVDRSIALIVQETSQDGTQPPITFSLHDARRTFGSMAELVGVGSYILKRLMNHRTMRSADVTQRYLHFSADELREPARTVERAILEHAGRAEKNVGLDAQLLALMGSMSEEEKQRVLFYISSYQRKEKEA
ncbi:TPA: tyrosine-type recombinase/integrase [Klebsiella pneumoniae]|uniref:site-specific integrase n=1 Tax=Klebsiella pneumoniae TaxID=573 RepID=UPI0015E92C1E|nr:site-specific integrase [Klebsiella pneumoniae]MBA8081651.1 site-specific integrase [Klebsiella pneumoniae]MBA8102604.1 site-specific integrase [Klebsiella pneumoniae]QMA10206.1 site-specific integrase [Klebsiella pneumoniae]QMA15437.1 site-specific integrase [Klebsiella pneumoniae]HBR7555685.1 site-specific integrase [Klebsiella pneumoniae]